MTPPDIRAFILPFVLGVVVGVLGVLITSPSKKCDPIVFNKLNAVGTSTLPNPASSVEVDIVVDVSGAVVNPGVYKLKKDSFIVEPTSGNTGIGLAMVAAIKGYAITLVMPEHMSVERRRIMAAYGAKFELTPREKGMPGAIAKAQEIVAANPNAWMPQQFENEANIAVHREKTAEEISKLTNFNLPELEKEILAAASVPTTQCRKLSHSIKKGIAFHHAGLLQKQKELIEDEFRKGTVKIICCTPTLAAGMSLPAFRVIIKSLKRYSGNWGMDWIPVLEYLQMAGRAGRPEYEKEGQAIILAKDEAEKALIELRTLRGRIISEHQ